MKTENLRSTQDWTQDMKLCSQRYEILLRKFYKTTNKIVDFDFESFVLECFLQKVSKLLLLVGFPQITQQYKKTSANHRITEYEDQIFLSIPQVSS